jgi:hypothetical protein
MRKTGRTDRPAIQYHLLRGVLAATLGLLFTPVKQLLKIALFPTISMNFKDMCGEPSVFQCSRQIIYSSEKNSKKAPFLTK